MSMLGLNGAEGTEMLVVNKTFGELDEASDEDTNAPAGAASQRAGAKTGMKGTVGAGSGAPKVTGGPTTPPATSR